MDPATTSCPSTAERYNPSGAHLECLFHQNATCVGGRAHLDLAGFLRATRTLLQNCRTDTTP